jgi:hypothetical protein
MIRSTASQSFCPWNIALALRQATVIALKVDDAILASLEKGERDMLRQLLDKLSPRTPRG